ncbi:MAG: hypothetical protein KDA73_14035 [Rhodobacteraceae bacterium]|nr:hypothetical protein [Paracoccaceae bacterium]
MTDGLLTARAREAASAWDGVDGDPRLVTLGKVAVYNVRRVSGRRMALRIHPAGKESRAAVIAEQRWTESLADAGFACPWPQRTRDNSLVPDLPDGTVASAVQWIDSRSLALPLSRPGTARADLCRQIGFLLADLHLTSDAVAPLDLHLPSGNPVEAAQLGRAILDSSDLARIRAAVNRAADHVDRIPEAQTGLIHGNVRPQTLRIAGNQLYLVGFFRGRRGYRLDDLAAALVPSVGAPDETAMRTALVDGYRSAEGPLPDTAFDALDHFMLLQALSQGDVDHRLEPIIHSLARRILAD